MRRKWWGNDDWERLQKMRAVDRARLLADRFQKELGYKHAVPWPIYDRKDGRTIMFFMVRPSPSRRRTSRVAVGLA